MNPIPDDDPISDGDPIPDGELLSAYLDGELRADERARVERLLAERPESRQLLDELRALRGTLEAVPRYRLEDDFAARVLRAAERAMLSGDALFLGQTEPSAPVAGDAHAEGDATEANGLSREAGKPVPSAAQEATWSTREAGWSWQRARRPMVWSCLALAAALLIMLVQPDGPAARRERKVALGRRNAEMDAANRDDVSLRKVPSPAAESAIRDAELEDLHADHLDGKRGDEEPAAMPGLDSPPTAPATQSQSPGTLGGGASAGNKPRAPSKPSRGAADSAPPSDAAGGMPSRGVRMAGPKKDEPTEPEARRDSAVDAVQLLDDDPTADDTLLIVCDVASDLVDSPEFQQLLAKHDIILEHESDEAPKGLEEKTAKSRGDDARASSGEKANGSDGDRELGMFLKSRRRFGDAQGEERGSVFEALDEALQVGEADGLLVEATEAQLEAVVADFERQSELFLSVAVHPAPDVPEQQALTAFSRARAAANRPAAPPADAAAADTPPPPAPAELPRAKTEDDTETKVQPAATPNAGSEPAEKFAAPLVQGRAKRLEARKLAELKQLADEDLKPETAPATKAGKQSRSKTQATSKTQPPSKAQPTAGEPTGAAANDDTGRLKAKARNGQDDKSKPAGASDVAEASSEKGKAGDGGQGGMARKATNGASVPRRALLIFRHVAPDAIESVPAEDP